MELSFVPKSEQTDFCVRWLLGLGWFGVKGAYEGD
jgi:hypothetical protein